LVHSFHCYFPPWLGLMTSGFLALSVVVAIFIIILHYTLSSVKNESIFRLLLTSTFLVAVLLYIGGQISALTFTSVSADCTIRNELLIAGDQFARISSILVALNIVQRSRSQGWKIGLSVWTIARLGISLISYADSSYRHRCYCFSWERCWGNLSSRDKLSRLSLGAYPRFTP